VKSYLVDEISAADLQRIRRFLREKATCSGLDTLFWVPVPESLLTPLQQEHLSCKPYRFAIETEEKYLKAELYVRTLHDMRCPCQGYCTAEQARFIIEWVNAMLQDLSIRT